MRLSIRTQTLLGVNLLVIALAVAFGWLAGRVAGDVVEERLAKEILRNTAVFLQARHLPFNDTVLRDLQRIFGVEFAIVRADDGTILGTSLADPDRQLLTRLTASHARVPMLAHGQQRYRVDSHDFFAAVPGVSTPQSLRLFALVPHAHFQAAREKAAGTVALFTLPLLLLATLLALLFSWTVTRPLRQLTREMDRRAAATVQANARPDDATEALAPGRTPAEIAGHAPHEIARLAAAFQHLLEQLRGAEKRLAEAERLATLGRLSATVAHELKNPLSGIKMNLRVLRDELERRGISDPSVAVMDHEIDRMDLYLQELMLLARPSPPGSEPVPAPTTTAKTPVALGDVAESVLVLMAARCAHAQVCLQRDFRPAPFVAADPAQLRQVILNLVVNALEAMPTGGTLSVAIADGANGVTCAVTDTGGGVHPPAGTDIFAPFTSTKSGNAGLGLYVCRRIVTTHAGRIDYDRNRSAGARFWFELPAIRQGANS